MRKKVIFLSTLCCFSFGVLSSHGITVQSDLGVLPCLNSQPYINSMSNSASQLDVNSLSAFRIQPTPQSYISGNDSIAKPQNYVLVSAESLPKASSELLSAIMPGKSDKAEFKVYAGIKGDKGIRKFSKNIPDRKEGYFLKIEKNQIVVAGHDERGLYYGLQTLSQLLTLNKLPLCEVKDYPDVPYRGVVEGFYGTPWSHEARLRQIEFYGRNKMNVYLYGPKDDPYHSVPNWRIPYPEKEAKQLKELVDKAKDNEVIFYWAIHPGQDIKWNDEDRDLLMKKFENMYQLGVRAFAVFFDDISGEGTKAEKQAELLNYIDENFVKVKGDVAPLVMCPTEYNKSWSNVKGGYLTTLGDKLNDGIEIMWTGDRVIACIDKQSMDFINPLLKRKAYIWWNFPVSDYVRDHLLLGPVYGNGLDIKDDLSAFVSNPMERPEASKIALYSVADYSWNLEDYDSDMSWNRALADLMPSNRKYLKVFASHNSDLGENGHGFRRDESVELKPYIEALQNKYISSGEIDEDAFQKVYDECEKIIYSSDMLLSSNESREFIDEVRPWIIQFKLLGEYGKDILNMIKLCGNKDGVGVNGSGTDNSVNFGNSAFYKYYLHAKSIQNQMYEVDATYNQNPYQPGVKTGSKYLLPCFYALFEKSTEKYNSLNGTDLATVAVYMPYSLNSNVRQLSQLPVRRKGKTGNISPSNEVILWQDGGFVEVVMDYPRSIKNVVFDLGELNEGISGGFEFEISSDSGKTWQTVRILPAGRKTQYKVEMENAGSLTNAGKVTNMRLRNKSGQEKRVYFKQFYFSE